LVDWLILLHDIDLLRDDSDTDDTKCFPLSQTQVIITRHSLVERKARYLFYCMFFFVFFVRSTISQQPAGRFTPKFACGRSLGRDVKSPLLGVGGRRRAEKGANEIFVTVGVNGKFVHFGGF